ncbi:MAG: hypothetical protein HKN25_09110 [Pyrinomonadaceae bacterium]|nr:hypothetical protein [Pyrinomonadaceae bacterium]
MKFLPPNFFFILLLLLPTYAFSFQGGSIVGEVYARERGKENSSLNFLSENRCKSEPCEKQQITRFSLSWNDRRLSDRLKLQVRYNWAEELDEFDSSFVDEFKQNRSSSFWLRPQGDALAQGSTNDFALFGGYKWECDTQRVKNRTTVKCEDKDPSTKEFDFYGRLDFGADYKYVLKEKFELKVGYNTDDYFDDKVKPRSLPKLELDDSLDGCYRPPFTVHPDQYFYGSLDQQKLRQTWQRNYGTPANGFKPTTPIGYSAFVISDGKRVWIPASMLYLAASQIFIRTMMPGGLRPGSEIWLVGMNVFGEVFYYGLISQTTLVAGRPPCNSGITRASKYVFEGRNLCVCGCYSMADVDDIDDAIPVFSLDGKPITPVSLSSTTATIRIPEGTAPGEHTISFVTLNDQKQSLKFRVLKLNGSIDQNALLRGESTTMRLQILGTEESLPLNITNKTPGVITITGGVKQVVKTTGGSSNTVQRNVKGIRVGDFKIDYSLDASPCPCYPELRFEE